MLVRIHGGRAAAIIPVDPAEQRDHLHSKLANHHGQPVNSVVESIGAGEPAAAATTTTTAENKQDPIEHI